jgi:hypothetical protein
VARLSGATSFDISACAEHPSAPASLRGDFRAARERRRQLSRLERNDGGDSSAQGLAAFEFVADLVLHRDEPVARTTSGPAARTLTLDLVPHHDTFPRPPR